MDNRTSLAGVPDREQYRQRLEAGVALVVKEATELRRNIHEVRVVLIGVAPDSPVPLSSSDAPLPGGLLQALDSDMRSKLLFDVRAALDDVRDMMHELGIGDRPVNEREVV